jgi:hypothetical protein
MARQRMGAIVRSFGTRDTRGQVGDGLRRARSLAASCLLAALAASAASAQPASYAEFDTSVRSGDGFGLQLLIMRGRSEAIYLPRGIYELDNPVTIDRTRPLAIHGADRITTALVARNPARPLFVLRKAPKFSLVGLHLVPSARQPNALNVRALHTQNTQPTVVEIQDCNIHSSMLELAGPGSYRIQSSVLTPSGRARTAVLLDHPAADLFLFGGDITNGGEQLRTDGYAHLWQKRGRMRLYAATLEAGLGEADVRIESASALGPHVLGNLRSEGANGALNKRGISRLLYVPPTQDRVDVVLKSNGGAWDTGPETSREARMNCKFVSYSATGTLWLLGNRAEGMCGRTLVEGNAPGATIVSVGNLISSPNAFTVQGARVYSSADAYNNYMWNGSEELPWTRWIPDGPTHTPLDSTAASRVPEDVLPPALGRPVMPAALPGMLDASRFGAVGDGVTDDTAALQRALDAECGPRNSKQLYIPAGTYRIRDTLYLRHHSGGSCHVGSAQGGWIAGAGSGRTVIAMDPAVKKSTFMTDGLVFATVQGITFKTYPWKQGEPKQPNFDLNFYPNHVATQLNNFYDVVFDGGYAAFATGVRFPTSGQCSSNMVFKGRMMNAHYGFVSGHYNAIANGVYDSEFVDNDVALASWTENEEKLPPGGTFFAYRSTSRGTREKDFELRGTANGDTFYAYEWDSDAPSYFYTGPSAAAWPLMFERSHLNPRPGAAAAFHVGTAQGPIFLHSTMTRGEIRVGQGGMGQNYAIKLNSDMPDWTKSVANKAFGKLADYSTTPLPLGTPSTPRPVNE